MACRLQEPLIDFISPAQTGFQKGRHSVQNIRRSLAAIWASNEHQSSADLVLSCDADKAFDRISWAYLRRFFKYHFFGRSIRNVFEALYRSPAATVTTNGLNSNPFFLERGTRQGCPLSPLFFNLAIEPLIRILLARPDVEGIRVGNQEVRVVAFADDLLLFLSDPNRALPTLLDYLERFHIASGFKINFEKTLAIPLGRNCKALFANHLPFSWCEGGTFKYLGLMLPIDLRKLYEVTIPPLVNQLKTLLSSWTNLPLSYMGRISLIKMVAFPRLLNPIQMLPILIKKWDISSIHSLFNKFIWEGGRARIALHKLQLPYSLGGVNMPEMGSYNLAAQYCLVADWITGSSRFTDYNLDQAMASPFSVGALLHLSPAALPPTQRANPLLNVGRVAWCKDRKYLGLSWKTSIYQPLLRNPNFQNGSPVPAFWALARKGLFQIGQVLRLPSHTLLSYEALSDIIAPTYLHPMYYLQLSTFVSQQLRELGPRDFLNPLDSIMKVGPSTATFRQTLRPHHDWTTATTGIASWYLHSLPQQSPYSLIAATSRSRKQIPSAQYGEMFYKLLHGAYVAPARLALYNPLSSGRCLKCSQDRVDLFHCLWSCPRIKLFWNTIRRFGSRVLKLGMPASPDWALFNILSDQEAGPLSRTQKTLLGIIAASAKKAILGQWIEVHPPSFSMFYSRFYSIFRHDWAEASLYKEDKVGGFFGVWGPFIQHLPEESLSRIKKDFQFTEWFLLNSLMDPPLLPTSYSRALDSYLTV
uniref:Reverse transcriptase domain-containing protein n=1 Tax=Leptobrachium leishanense TaxID=445787 RepID=A0A8C5PFS8_9ANUR